MTPTDKPKMLFVDDRSRRIHSALRQYSDKYDVTIAPNVPETIRLLSRKDWNVVSLDYDLDGLDYANPESRTCAMEIVRYIEKMGWPPNRQMPYFKIHTSNSFAAEFMYQHLVLVFGADHVDILPFRYDEAE